MQCMVESGEVEVVVMSKGAQRLKHTYLGPRVSCAHYAHTTHTSYISYLAAIDGTNDMKRAYQR
jgi:hypothetical protein